MLYYYKLLCEEKTPKNFFAKFLEKQFTFFFFCEALYKEYEADPDKGNPVSLEEAAQLLGVSL